MGIKEWLVKKLGGYTKYEYDFMAKRPVAKFTCRTGQVQKLKVCNVIPEERIRNVEDLKFYQAMVTQDLKSSIVKKLEEDGYLTFRSYTEENGTHVISCELYAARAGE